MTTILASTRTELSGALSSIDRLSQMISAMSLDISTPVSKPKIHVKVKSTPSTTTPSQVPLATTWRWRYEDTDDFSQESKDPQTLITDIRDWFDLTTTERSCFDTLLSRLSRSVQGSYIRIQVKRQGRQVILQDCVAGVIPDVIINCL